MIGKVNNDHIKGAAVALGTCTVAYYLYKRNECKVDEFLRKQGIRVPASSSRDYSSMTIEELMETKETIEDIIAEKELICANQLEVNTAEGK